MSHSKSTLLASSFRRSGEVHSPERAHMVSSFFPVPRFEPDRRAMAGKLLHLPLLEGIAVKGELEAHHSAENKELRREREVAARKEKKIGRVISK